MSDNGVTVELIADLAGHHTTIVTQKVYYWASIPVPSAFQPAFRKTCSYLRKFATGLRVKMAVRWKRRYEILSGRYIGITVISRFARLPCEPPKGSPPRETSIRCHAHRQKLDPDAEGGHRDGRLSPSPA